MEEELNVSKFKTLVDFFDPDTKMCILLQNSCKKGKVLKSDFLESAIEGIEDNYKNEETARQMAKRIIEKFEKMKLISTIYEKGEAWIVLDKLKDIEEIGFVKVGKMFSNRIMFASLVISMLVFFVSFFSSRVEIVVLAAFYFGLIFLMYFSYRESFVFK